MKRDEEERNGQAEEIAQPFPGQDRGPGHGVREHEAEDAVLPLPADLVEAEEKRDQGEDDLDDVDEVGGGEEGEDGVSGLLARRGR